MPRCRSARSSRSSSLRTTSSATSRTRSSRRWPRRTRTSRSSSSTTARPTAPPRRSRAYRRPDRLRRAGEPRPGRRPQLRRSGPRPGPSSPSSTPTTSGCRSGSSGSCPILTARPEIGMVTSDAYIIEETRPDHEALLRRPAPLPVPGPRGRAARRDRPAELPVHLGASSAASWWSGAAASTSRCGGPRTTSSGPGSCSAAPGPRSCPTRSATTGSGPTASSASKEQWGAHLSVLEKHLPELWRHGARGRARDVFEIGERLAGAGRPSPGASRSSARPSPATTSTGRPAPASPRARSGRSPCPADRRVLTQPCSTS